MNVFKRYRMVSVSYDAAELHISVDLLCDTTAAELHNLVDLLCDTTTAELHNSVNLLCETTAANLWKMNAEDTRITTCRVSASEWGKT